MPPNDENRYSTRKLKVNLGLLISVASLIGLTFLQNVTNDGVGIFLALIPLGIWCGISPNDTRRIKIFFATLLTPILMYAVGIVLYFIGTICPKKYDRILYAIDNSLKFCPSAVAATLGRPVEPFLLVIYKAMVPVIVLSFAWSLYDPEGRPRTVLSALIYNGIPSAFLYFIVPACGPGFLFGSEFRVPHEITDLSLVMLSDPANCVPSIHFSMALTIWYFAPHRGLYRPAAAFFFVATAAATLVLGEHYLLDLVLALPYAVFAIRCAEGSPREGIFFLGALVLILLAVRFAPRLVLQYSFLFWGIMAIVAFACFRELFASSRQRMA